MTEQLYSAERGVQVYDKTTKLALAIDELERFSLKHPQVELPTVHRFTPGLYIRECFTPKNILFTSAIHRFEHPFVISMGEVEILTEEGWRHVMSPFTGITKPGTRRVVRTLDDTICTTFHVNPTDERDLEKLEAMLYEPHNDHHAILRARRVLQS